MVNLRDALFYLKSDYVKEHNPEKYKRELEKFYKMDLHNAVKENIEWFSQHPNLYTDHKIYFTIHLNEFKGLTIAGVMQLKERFNQAATGLFGLEADNFADLLLSDSFGHLYKFGVYGKDNSFKFMLWNDTGALHLLTIQVQNKLSPANLEQIAKVMSNYQRGIINCSDCGKEIYKHEIGGQYFAGRYCKECWERKWKEVASKETYD